MISQTAECALRATVFLADQNGMPQTNAQSAELLALPKQRKPLYRSPTLPHTFAESQRFGT